MDPLFNAKLKRNGDCLEWQGATQKGGYGRLVRKQKAYYCHRYAWMLKYGEIPEGTKVRHKCDNPLCCNVDHLELGTQRQNIEDMVLRGRSLKGARNVKSKLTEADVREIRRKVAAGASQTAVAREYSMGTSAISDIVRRVNWGWLED